MLKSPTGPDGSDNVSRLRSAIDNFVAAVQSAVDDGHNGNVGLTVNIHNKEIKEPPKIIREYYPRS